jgi:hypothetical protein
VFIVINGNNLGTNYTATGLTTGNTYVFKVQARNSYGLSLYSNQVTILIATAPSKPFTPMTSVSADQAVITWVAPSANGSPITSYSIYVKTKAGTYSQDLTNCDGSAATIVRDTVCRIPLLTL